MDRAASLFDALIILIAWSRQQVLNPDGRGLHVA
jgi:hypothetical protein